LVAIPSDGKWSLRPLSENDGAEALRFLRRDPLLNVFLIARILEDGLAAGSPIVEVRRDRETICIASLGTNVVLAADRHDHPDRLEMAIALIADRIVNRMVPVRAIICSADLVDTLWQRLRTRIDPPSVVRMNQPIYALMKMRRAAELQSARFATIADLDQLVPACAAMHLEEVGINPLDRDALGYRERIRELVEKRHSIIRMEGGEIAFKCEFSAVTPEAVQLMGVWTAPQYRNRGFARQTLEELCGMLIRGGRSVTLFVNDFNTPAIRLYESLGFERIGTNRALIW
jgi:predicted GNAT family acetyltransferase